MFGDETYSQLVGFLKVSLPLAALALMSTVFLFARAPSQENTIPYAELEQIAQEARLTGAHMSGVAQDGSVIEVNARSASPQGDVISIETMTAIIEAADGTQTNISAARGEIDNANRTATLTGLTRIQTSNGYDMETAGVMTDLNTGRIVTDGALEVRAPFGLLTAGQLTIETPDNATGQVMIFQNGVRLIYMPKQ